MQIDDSQVQKLLNSLSEEKLKEVMTVALKKGADALRDQTRANASVCGYKVDEKMLKKGIKSIKDKDYGVAVVSIMGDYRLKWFEKGTQERYTKKKKAYRGSLKAKHFFADAKANEAPVIQAIMESLNAQLNKLT